VVSWGYFRIFGISFLRGWGFEEADREGAFFVGFVNQEFERVFLAGETALGKRFRRSD
jgi:hypothetical protein